MTSTWKTTGTRFVGFFDIMGFKNRVQRGTHRQVLSSMKRIHTDIIKPMKEIEDFIKPIIFSDSILIISNTDTKEELYNMAVATAYLLNTGFEIGLPIKGAISLGKFTADFEKSIYFGEPLIDAYLLQDELLMYGAIFDHTIDNFIYNNNDDDYRSLINQYKVPLKSGKITHYVSDWSYIYEKPAGMKNVMEKLYHTVSGKPRIYVDNTMDYVNHLATRHVKKQSKKR